MFRSKGVTARRVIDVGGSKATAAWLAGQFPEAEITILNSDTHEPGAIHADAQAFDADADVIFAGELIEHLWNPDGLIESAAKSLPEGGWFVITTPNLACLINRIFLLFGWTPGNISPSVRYVTGNPMLPTGSGEIGTIAFHKSVFTYRGLVELLRLYGFDLVDMRGYTYAPPPGKAHVGLGGREIQSGGYRLRRLANSLTPHSVREGMALLLRHNPDRRTAPPLTVGADVPDPNRPT